MEQNTNSNINYNNEEIVIDLREVFGILKRNILKVLFVTALFVCAAGGYVFVTPNQYECSVQLSLGRGMDNFFKTRSLFIPIITKYCEKDKDGKYPTAKDYMKKCVTYTQPRNSDYLTIAVRDKSLEVAQKILGAVIDGGMEQYIQSKAGARKQQLAIYRDMLREVKEDKTKSELFVKIAEIENSIKALKNDIMIVDSLYCDEKPVAPRKVRIMAVAFVLGIICGSMYVVLKEKL